MSEPELSPGAFPRAFETVFARLQVRLERACIGEPSSDWPAQIAAAICAALDFAAADPAAAYLLTSGALAHGKPGFARYDRMLDHFAERLRPGRVERPEGAALPEITEKAMVGGLAMMIAHRVDTGRAADLPGFAVEAIQFVLTPYLGAERARRVAEAQSTLRE